MYNQEEDHLTINKCKLQEYVVYDFQLFKDVLQDKYSLIPKFVSEVFSLYNDLPYHNIYHAYEVFKFCKETYKKTQLSKDIGFLLCVCALCHDIKHNGRPNEFQQNFKVQIQLNLETTKYQNSFSTNENIHIQTCIHLCYKYGFHLVLNIPNDIYMETFIQNTIIFTDLSNLSNFNNNIKYNNYNDIILSTIILLCADLSHFTKHFRIHCYWYIRLMQEINTYDSISLSKMANNNFDFIDTIVLPVFSLLKESGIDVSSYINGISENRYIWQKHSLHHKSSKIDILSFDDNFKRKSLETRHHQNVCICMIDIVNFSKWCSIQEPQNIFNVMTLFNQFLSKRITLFDDIEKIELVGDSVLIIGGFENSTNVSKNVFDIIKLSESILYDLHKFKELFRFGSNSINSLRIGIHVGDIYSGFINNPSKFQVFGNAINIASRLEGITVPGTFSISSLALSFLEDKYMNKLNCTFGKEVEPTLKGVGAINYCSAYINKNEILIADDDSIFLEVLKKIISKCTLSKCITETSIDEVWCRLRENIYTCAIIDINFGYNTVFNLLKNFRIWESIYRKTQQKIYIISSFDNDDEMKRINDKYSHMYQGFINKNTICQLDENKNLIADLQ